MFSNNKKKKNQQPHITEKFQFQTIENLSSLYLWVFQITIENTKYHKYTVLAATTNTVCVHHVLVHIISSSIQ